MYTRANKYTSDSMACITFDGTSVSRRGLLHSVLDIQSVATSYSNKYGTKGG